MTEAKLVRLTDRYRNRHVQNYRQTDRRTNRQIEKETQTERHKCR